MQGGVSMIVLLYLYKEETLTSPNDDYRKFQWRGNGGSAGSKRTSRRHPFRSV